MLPKLAFCALAASLLAAAPASAQRDGTSGNPPSTATQRATDRLTGSPPSPADGTPGNPPGTAAGRASDHALGSDTAGAHRRHARRHRARHGRSSAM
jgi:hypothetical protein